MGTTDKPSERIEVVRINRVRDGIHETVYAITRNGKQLKGDRNWDGTYPSKNDADEEADVIRDMLLNPGKYGVIDYDGVQA